MENEFDVAILGTGLAESILAAALSKSNLRVLHLDSNAYYGSDEASLSLSELSNLAESRHWTVERNGSIGDDRAFSLSLMPSILPATGPLITTLIESGVSTYTSFKLLDDISIYSSSNGNTFTSVPTSKATIFTSPLSHLQKRKLMRLIQMLVSSPDLRDRDEIKGKEDMGIVEFLMLPSSEGGSFGLTEDVATSVAYSFAFGEKESDTALETLLHLQSFLRSAGRYGDSPFLIGHYGGLGEIAQGFCRMSAVHDGTYILGHDITAINRRDGKDGWDIEIQDIPDILSARLLIGEAERLQPWIQLQPEPPIGVTPSSADAKANCIAIIPRGNGIEQTALRVFPPNCDLPTNESDESDSRQRHPFTIRALSTGSDSMACPSDYLTVYLQTSCSRLSSSISAANLLRPYLHKIHPAPPFATYYDSQSSATSSSTPEEQVVILPASLLSDMAFTNPGDTRTEVAKAAFWDVLKRLGVEVEEEGEMWPPREDLLED